MAHDILRRLAANSQAALDGGTYDIRHGRIGQSGRSMADDIRSCKNAFIISEIKFASPSEGTLREASDPVQIAVQIASQMTRGGAGALSVLTQPHLFGGSPEYFAAVRRQVGIPMIMKDIIIDKRQVDAAYTLGADYVLLIWSVFESGLAAGRAHTPDEFISYAHQKGIGVLLEVHTTQEYAGALDTMADIIGINNRNLDTLEIDTKTTEDILSGCKAEGRITISESGISGPDDIRYLRRCGADGFLVGSSIMKSSGSIEEQVRRLVMAY